MDTPESAQVEPESAQVNRTGLSAENWREVPIHLLLEVDYEKDEPFVEMHRGKHYPITIKEVKLRGKSIRNLLHVSHIMYLQRIIYFMEIGNE